MTRRRNLATAGYAVALALFTAAALTSSDLLAGVTLAVGVVMFVASIWLDRTGGVR